MPLSAFTPAVAQWFENAFKAPTEVQAQAWPAIATGEHTLISAPTGSGKTLAAFLWGLDQFVREPQRDVPGTRLVYVSPLKALAYDVDRNLRAPLRGIGADVSVAIRTGDTSQKERAQMKRTPPDILITTPESLYLILTSQARSMLEHVQSIILDEIHAVAATKRGSHMALTLERLTALNTEREVQRIGLSATQNPLEEVGRYMVGPRRQCTIVDAGVRKPLDLKIHVPVESMVEPEQSTKELDPLDPLVGGEATRKSIWPAIYPELLKLVREHKSTIVFVNNRRGAERLALRLNELATAEAEENSDEPVGAMSIARAHHGSLAREERTVVEELLKSGELPCLVATSSLELGIDMGAVDLVLQIESPKSVARGLQRIGRAGHNVGDTSKGRIFPKFRGDLLECAVIVKLMREGRIEKTVVPKNALDVLAQQIVAIVASGDPEPTSVDDLYALVTRTHSYAELTRELLENVLDMLDGRYPSQEFGELRPAPGVGSPRRDAAPAQGRAGPGDRQRGDDPRPRPVRRRAARRAPRRRARRGDGLRGAAGPDVPARRLLLADRGDRPRPRRRDARAGRARGAAVLEGRHRRAARRSSARPSGSSRARRSPSAGAARGGVRPRPARRQEPDRVPAGAAGGHADRALGPHARRRALPRRDRRLADVHPEPLRRPRARRLGARAERPHPRPATASSPTRSTPTTGSSSTCPTPTSRRAPSSSWSRRTSSRSWSSPSSARSALFGARFRENAGRALLIPRAYPGKRTPLWQQRLKSQSLLEVAKRYADFPIILETYRECLRDVLDVPGLEELLTGLHSREIGAGRGRDPERLAVRQRRCCSTTSRPTCTRATRPTPSGAPRRSRSTATCCASCSARRSCAT